MLNIQEIKNMQDFLRFLVEIRSSLMSNRMSFSDLCNHLSSYYKDKNQIKKYILEVIRKWKMIEELGNIGYDHCIIQDVFMICGSVYKNDEEIARTVKEVLLNEDGPDMEKPLEVEKFVTMATSCTFTYGVFSKNELTKISKPMKDEYPWLWVDILSRHNWTMMVNFAKDAIKTDNDKLNTRMFYWKGNKTKEQLQYAFDAWEDILNKWQKDYFIKILNGK